MAAVPAPWNVFHPLTVAAALLMPLHWPFLLSCHRGTLLQRGERAQAFFTQRPVGTGLDLWLWQRLAPFVGLGRRPWGAWLLLPAGVMGLLWVSTVVALLVWAAHRLLGLPWPVFAVTLYLGCIGAFGVTLPLRPGLVGRSLLLPGGPQRAGWPRWVAARQFAAVGAGLAVAWLPTVIAAHLGGLAPADVLTLLLAVAATLAAAVVWQLFSLVRRAGPQRRAGAGIQWALPTAAVVLAAGVSTVGGAPWPVQATCLALALGWLAGLLAYALRGAPRCVFDA
jgi:hypothetical protein